MINNIKLNYKEGWGDQKFLVSKQGCLQGGEEEEGEERKKKKRKEKIKPRYGCLTLL